MRVIPVIDLMQGRVVRGIAGRRESYRPIESQIVEGADPASIAAALVGKFSAREIYVADLDAIAGGPPDLLSLEAITCQDLDIWLDAGVGDVERARSLCSRIESSGGQPRNVVVGLESVAGPSVLADVFEVLGDERAVFSLDLKGSQPLSGDRGWGAADAQQIALAAIEIGFRQMIVLDLAEVGMNRGTAGVEQICRWLHDRHPGVELISGGGVRGLSDLRRLAEAGCSAALVASALHDGKLMPADVQTAEDFNS